MNVLELQNIKKYFATQKAVDDISMTIGQGNIFGLLGPNGAGKTTLLRMITGIFYPDSGQILFDGKKFNALDDARNIGYMPEERGLSQKLQFVTTVLHKPKLIILDEPFSGLDPVNANLIKDEIFNLAKNGSTIIFSTHRMEQVEEICNHIVLVNKGKKILDGTVHEVKQQYKDNIYQLGASVLPEHLMTHIFEIVKHEPDRLLLKLQEGTTSNDVLTYFINQGIVIHSFHEVLPSLNDIFIKLVEGTSNARAFQNV